MVNWRGFVARVIGLAAMQEAIRTEGTLVAARMPRVAEIPKPRPAGMATEWERNIRGPKKGKGTRKQRKEANRRMDRREVALNVFYRWQMTRAFMACIDGNEVIRYGGKAHRRALAKLNR